MKKFLLILTLILFLGFSTWFGNLYSDIQQAKQNSVLIEGTILSFWGKLHIIGTGVVIDSNGSIITAKHCVEDINDLQITLDGVIYYPDSNDIFLDSDSDIALIKLKNQTSEFAVFGNSNDLSCGNIIYGIGTAKGIFDNNLSLGYIYKNHFKRLFFGNNDFIMAKMKIFVGCSGGGVYRYNKLIGIMIASNDGYSFIISEEEIQKFIEEID